MLLLRPLLLLLLLNVYMALAKKHQPQLQQPQKKLSDSTNMLKLRLGNGSVIPLWELKEDSGTRFGCQHTRYSVVVCIRDYLDTNHDYAITEDEIDDAKVRYMYWIERKLEWFMRDSDTVAVRKRCDLNHNGKIDLHDLVEWNERCMHFTKQEAEDSHNLCLCACGPIDNISNYICDRAARH